MLASFLERVVNVTSHLAADSGEASRQVSVLPSNFLPGLIPAKTSPPQPARERALISIHLLKKYPQLFYRE
jgi:hypothetical protein